jgi:hypothetical protein
MGIADLFKKRSRDEISGTQILVASLDSKFSTLAQADKSSYAKFYAMPSEETFNTIEALLDEIRKGHDVVHLFCDVSADGNILDSSGVSISGTALVQTAVNQESSSFGLRAPTDRKVTSRVSKWRVSLSI